MLLVVKYWVAALAAAMVSQYVDASTTTRNINNAGCHCLTEVNPYYRPGNNTAVAFGKHLLVDGVVLFTTRRWSDSSKTIIWAGIAANSIVQTNVNNQAWNNPYDQITLSPAPQPTECPPFVIAGHAPNCQH